MTVTDKTRSKILLECFENYICNTNACKADFTRFSTRDVVTFLVFRKNSLKNDGRR